MVGTGHRIENAYDIGAKETVPFGLYRTSHRECAGHHIPGIKRKKHAFLVQIVRRLRFLVLEFAEFGEGYLVFRFGGPQILPARRLRPRGLVLRFLIVHAPNEPWFSRWWVGTSFWSSGFWLRDKGSAGRE
eukprot:2455184-Rhodomonas_salina.1